MKEDDGRGNVSKLSQNVSNAIKANAVFYMQLLKVTAKTQWLLHQPRIIFLLLLVTNRTSPITTHTHTGSSPWSPKRFWFWCQCHTSRAFCVPGIRLFTITWFNSHHISEVKWFVQIHIIGKWYFYSRVPVNRISSHCIFSPLCCAKERTIPTEDSSELSIKHFFLPCKLCLLSPLFLNLPCPPWSSAHSLLLPHHLFSAGGPLYPDIHSGLLMVSPSPVSSSFQSIAYTAARIVFLIGKSCILHPSKTRVAVWGPSRSGP